MHNLNDNFFHGGHFERIAQIRSNLIIVGNVRRFGCVHFFVFHGINWKMDRDLLFNRLDVDTLSKFTINCYDYSVSKTPHTFPLVCVAQN